LIICEFSKVLVAGGIGFVGSRLFDDDSVCVAVMCLLCSAREAFLERYQLLARAVSEWLQVEASAGAKACVSFVS